MQDAASLQLIFLGRKAVCLGMIRVRPRRPLSSVHSPRPSQRQVRRRPRLCAFGRPRSACPKERPRQGEGWRGRPHGTDPPPGTGSSQRRSDGLRLPGPPPLPAFPAAQRSLSRRRRRVELVWEQRILPPGILPAGSRPEQVSLSFAPRSLPLKTMKLFWWSISQL